MRLSGLLACATMLVFQNACGAAAISSSKAERDGLVVEVRAGCASNSPALMFSIMNITSAPITINALSMPWEPGIDGATLDVRSGKRSLMRREIFPTAHLPAPLRLQPEQREEGVFDLGYWYPEFREAVRKGSIVVVWSYDARFIGKLVLTADPCPK